MGRSDQDLGAGRPFQDTSAAGKHTPEAAGTSPSDGGAGAVDLGGVEKLPGEVLGLEPALEVAELVVEEVQLLLQG